MRLYYKVLPTQLENIDDILMSLQNWRTTRPRGMCPALSKTWPFFKPTCQRCILKTGSLILSSEIFQHFVMYSFYKCICISYSLWWCTDLFWLLCPGTEDEYCLSQCLNKIVMGVYIFIAATWTDEIIMNQEEMNKYWTKKETREQGMKENTLNVGHHDIDYLLTF